MKLYLVRPFRIPFNLPKYRVLANNAEWMQVMAEARPKLSCNLPEFAALTQVELGNYGWNRSRDVIYDVDNPGWFFSDFFLARFSGKLSPEDFSDNLDPTLADQFDQQQGHWHCWIIDNTLAVLVVEVKIREPAQFLLFHDQHRDMFRDFNENWPQTLLQEAGPVQNPVKKVCSWLTEQILKPYSQLDSGFLSCAGLLLPEGIRLAGLTDAASTDQLNRQDNNGNLFTQAHPVYSKAFQGLWTHTLYAFEQHQGKSDEFENALKKAPVPMQNVLGEPLLEDLKQHKNHYGWGWSALFINHEAPLKAQFGLEGLVVMQYFYSCFDVADTLLPKIIASSQVHLGESHYQDVMKSARQSQFELANLVNDYNDLQIRASYEAHIAMERYHQNWRLDDLLANIGRKQVMMENLVSSASDAIDKRSESGIQLILLGISALSLIGLFASLHEYLSGGYQARFADPLQQWALSWDKWEVTIFTFALVAILAILAAWMLMRDSLRNAVKALRKKLSARDH